MTDELLVWHHGLMAERWAECIEDALELPFFRRAIARFGQPVLDIACGTGRLLLPLLRDGLDIDGCDFSADMLGHARRRAAAEGFSPHLYQQPMHRFSVPRRYWTIYICDSFGLAGSRENDLETLRRCNEHLEEGGALIVNIDAEYTIADMWNLWLSENRKNLPQPWPLEPNCRTAADGSEHRAWFRFIEIDPLEQSYLQQVRLEKWRAGERLATEEYTLRENVYLNSELLLMLKVAGFRSIELQGDFTDEPATASSKRLVFTAIR